MSLVSLQDSQAAQLKQQNIVSQPQQEVPSEARPEPKSEPQAAPMETVITLGSWRDNWNEWVKKYIQPGTRDGYFDLVVEQLHDDIYHFPLFTEAFCTEFIAHTEQNADWTRDRHQFYPTNDVLLTDLGMAEMYYQVLEAFCHPIARIQWRLKGDRWQNTMVDESFVARYKAEEQQSLAVHSDFSDYTFTVGLNTNFDGGGTWFPRQQVLANPRGGYCTLFPSMTHPHGGRPTLRGTRYILVSFCRRANLYVQ